MKKNIYLFMLFLLLIIITFLLINDRNVYLFNKKYSKNIEYLELRNVNIKDDNWLDKLGEFKKLKNVNLVGNDISLALKEKIIGMYPNINFDIVTTINIYDMSVKENVRFLDLSNTLIDENIIDYLKYFKLIEEVNFGKNIIDTNLLLEIKDKYPNIKIIGSIKINDNAYNLDIKKLDLSNQIIKDKDIFIKSLKLFYNLEYLDMSSTNFTNEELANLRIIYPNIKIDWIVYLGKWSLKTLDESFSVLVGKIDYKRMTSEDIDVLKYCTNLKALDLGHQKITDISVIGNYLKDLRILILADNKISDISPLKNLKHLHYVELFLNKIEDVSPLSNCLELVDINISYNKINSINSLLKFEQLERLWTVNSNLSQTDIKLLKDNYPNKKINTNFALTSTGSGWREHIRYDEMIKMFYNPRYISNEFMKYDKN